jgi:ATP-dependent DNA helicase RecQ
VSDDVAILENFAFGDTPTTDALRGVISDVLERGPKFDISLYTLGNEHDVRPLVLRTALTYLELMGVIRQGTPFYAGYKIRPNRPVEEIVARFQGERSSFVAGIFSSARKGRDWYTLDPAAVARALDSDRDRVIAAVGYLADVGLADVQVSDARQRFTRGNDHPDRETLVGELVSRFSRREQQEVERIARIVELISTPRCQTAFLVGYFGETLPGPCGHCTFCETGFPTRIPPSPPQPDIADLVDTADLLEIRAQQPRALAHPRQIARFLCGLTSPATSRARLTRHRLFGALEGRRFQEVLRWCESLAGEVHTDARSTPS